MIAGQQQPRTSGARNSISRCPDCQKQTEKTETFAGTTAATYLLNDERQHFGLRLLEIDGKETNGLDDQYSHL